MKRYRKWVAAIATVALGLGLAGCGDDDEGIGSDGYKIKRLHVDGKELICVEWAGYKKGGLTCNWDEFNRPR